MFIKFEPPFPCGFSKIFGGLIGCGFSGKSLVYTSWAPPTIPINSLMALRISSLESSLVSIVSFISFSKKVWFWAFIILSCQEGLG